MGSNLDCRQGVKSRLSLPRDGKFEVHPAHQRMMAKVILAHPREHVEMSAAELERYPTQARERDDAPKQAPRRGRSR
jgi:hypothetical protein